MVHRLVAYAALCSLPVPFVAHEDDTPEHRLAALTRAFVEQENVTGLSAVVAIGPDVDYETGLGYADPAARSAATPDSPYRAGSLTAPFVALLLYDLHEEGALDLDDAVTKHLAGLDLGETVVTLEQLLAHTSGLPGYAAAFADKPFDPGAVLAWLATEPRLAEPGTCVAYSETDDLLAGLVLEQVSGRRVRELVETSILKPFGMDDSKYCWDGPALHEREPASQEFRGELVTLPGRAQPFEAAGLCTTARDLALFQRALVEERLIDAEGFERMTTAVRLDDAVETGYGLGLGLGELDGRKRISYGGGLEGSLVHVAYYPEAELTIALLAHGEDADLAALANALARIVLDVPDETLVDLPLEEADAARYLGTYVAGCIQLEVEHDGEHLVLRPSVGSRQVLWRQAQNVFAVADDPGVRVTFRVQDDEVTSLIFDDHGTVIEARR